MTAVKVLVAAIVVLAATAMAVLLSGVYDIGADAPHWPWVERLAGAVRNASISARASDIKPPDLENRQRIASGARHYAQMCAGCHLAPGTEDSEIRKGLYPRPPALE